MSGKFEICNLEEISDYLEKNELSIPEHAYKIRVVAHNKARMIDGVCLFTSPTDEKIKKKYTKECFFFHSENPEVSLIEFLRLYLKSYRTSDVFVYNYIKNSSSLQNISDWMIEKGGYGWVNPQRKDYTYKITASDSPKYYFGVKSIYGDNITESDCLKDGYWGSGKGHFQRWKKKHEGTLSKEILGVFSRKAEAYAHEKELVGNRWKEDSNCLNATAGGLGSGKSGFLYSEKECPIHGLTLFIGDKCCSCIANDSLHEDHCEIHGATIFIGEKCRKCISAKSVSIVHCEVHGELSSMWRECPKCLYERNFIASLCSIHGETSFIGSSCQKCNAEKMNSVNICEIHGEGRFQWGRCAKCSSQNTLTEKECLTHGVTVHRGGSCFKCVREATDSEKECLIHGITKHRGENCFQCQAERAVNIQICPIHGEGKFIGEQCYKCISSNTVTMAECSTHGLTKHRGEKCCKCISPLQTVTGVCDKHGEAKFQHNRCCKCMGEKGVHTRYHKENPKKDCIYCLPSKVELV